MTYDDWKLASPPAPEEKPAECPVCGECEPDPCLCCECCGSRPRTPSFGDGTQCEACATKDEMEAVAARKKREADYQAQGDWPRGDE